MRCLQRILENPDEKPAIRENAKTMLEKLRAMDAQAIEPAPKSRRAHAPTGASSALRKWTK
jgi:hypothetical protein